MMPNIHNLEIIINSAIGFIALFGLIYTLFVRINRLSTKVNTIWEFLLRRAISEAVQKGIGSFASPFKINHEVKEWMNELAAELKDFYRKTGRHLDKSELILEIERLYGEEILQKICIPNGLSQGACLLIAAEVAEELIDLKEVK